MPISLKPYLMAASTVPNTGIIPIYIASYEPGIEDITGKLTTRRLLTGYDSGNISTRRIVAETSSGGIDTLRIIELKSYDDKGNIDTARYTLNVDVASLDTCRTIALGDSGSIDTMRELAMGIIGDFDTLRLVTATDAASIDTARRLSGRDDGGIDTERMVVSSAKHDVGGIDTMRQLYAATSGKLDAARMVHASVENVMDTLRTLYGTVQDDGIIDTSRALYEHNTGHLDAVRYVTTLEDGVLDSRRILFDAGTGITDNGRFDTARVVPDVIKDYNLAGIQSITINLNANQLSDSFSMVTTQHKKLLDRLHGRLLDYDYSYTVEKTVHSGLLMTCEGMLDVDLLIEKPIWYTVKETTAAEHAKTIANIIGKKPLIYMQDFTHETDVSTLAAGAEADNVQEAEKKELLTRQTTYKSIISTLFGWTSDFAFRQINVFVRNNKFYVVQRGLEPNTVDLTTAKRTRPQVERTLYRTADCTGKGCDENAENIGSRFWSTGWGFTGSIGNTKYIFGFASMETTPDGVTSYVWDTPSPIDGSALLLAKNTRHSDGSRTEIRYKYGSTDRGAVEVNPNGLFYDDSVLIGEEETTVSADGEKTIRRTYHSQESSGQRAAYVYTPGASSYFDGSIQAQGGGGARTKPWRCGAYDVQREDEVKTKTLKDELSLPIKEDDLARQFIAEKLALDRAIEERLSFDLYQYPHMIDFTDKIVIDGNVYHLESNTISRTPRELKQSITCVRWYHGQ